VNSLELIASSPRVFADNGFQHAAQALAGLFGMVSLDMNDPNINFGDVAKASVFWILDFSVTRLKETRNLEESAAVVRFLEKLLSYLFPEESIPEGSLCLTQIVEIAARYIFPQSGDTKVSEKILDLFVPMMPDPGSSVEADVIYYYLDRYIPGDPASYTKTQRIEAFLKACAWGPADGTKAKEDGETAEDVSSTLCTVIGLAATFGFVDMPTWMILAFDDPDDPAKFPGQIADLLQFLMPEGETYLNLTTAADIWGRHAAESLYRDPLNALADQGYSQGYIDDAWRHFNDLLTYIRPLRTVLLTFLFSSVEEPLSVEGMIRNLSLFVANDGLIAPSHYVQVDLVWAKARRAKGIWDHTSETTPSPTPSPTLAPTPSPTPKPLPPTGDASTPLLWIGLALLGLLGLAFCLGAKKKIRKR